MGKATEGLYQYASAGVSASEAMEMLTHTLTLSMAVQGDHNTLAKLTTQTIMGFGMEFSDAAEVTDKFAHAINMSLIEWDDLASSVKFALPFFISTGQSLDQLLGALSVLTNRALEAGIAGRGLRQALAEFTQHAEDNSAAFRKLGVEILDLEGNMYPLDQIAKQFNDTMGESATDMEIMIALMEDLNIRGATAFIHLVQNADEFTAQVNDLQNSAGAAVEMAEIQQQSLAMQIQLVKNALQAPFLLADEVGQAHGYLNEFSMIMHQIVSMFEDLIVTGEEGNKKLTEMGQFLKDFVIVAMKEFAVIIEYTLQLMKSWSDEHGSAYAALSLLTIPLQTLLRLMSELGPFWLNTILMYKILNTLLPVNIVLTMQQMKAELMHIAVLEQDLLLSQAKAKLTQLQNLYTLLGNRGITDGATKRALSNQIKEQENIVDGIKNSNAKIDLMMTMRLIVAKIALHFAMFAIVAVSGKMAQENPRLAGTIAAVAGAVMGMAIAWQLARTAMKGNWAAWAGAAVAGMLIGYTFHRMMAKLMKPPDVSSLGTLGTTTTEVDYSEPIYDTGGRITRPRMYGSGGRVGNHFPVMVEPGETITSKTQNMLGGGGITLNMGDVYANDAEDFAERVAEALPIALQRQSNMGGI